MLILFTLVMFRLTGLFLGAPVFNRTVIPPRFRVILAVAIVPALMPLAQPAVMPTGADVFVAMFSELAIGFSIGLIARLLISSFQIAGQIMGFQMGLAMANVFDPDSQAQTSVVASTHLNLVGVLFLVLDGHHLLLTSVASSYLAFPIGAPLATGVLADALFQSGAAMWEVGARVAGPITALMLLTNAFLGFLNRVIPQLSIFNVGLPMTVLTGLIALMIALPESAHFFVHAFDELEVDLATLLAE